MTRALAILLAAAASAATAALATPDSRRSSTAVDSRLCGFPLHVTVRSETSRDVVTTFGRLSFGGPSTITLRNGSTGRTAVLRSSGSHFVDTRNGTIAFRGHQVWHWSTGAQVPFLATDGAGSFRAPTFELHAGGVRGRVIDPCALVGPSAASTQPATTQPPWGLPRFVISRIGYAGLTPLLGAIVRHDHVHLDVIVDGRKVTVPAGVGLAEPADRGPCPTGNGTSGDCATGQSFFGQVANSPLHTHSPSGLIHIEADRHERYTLGQFFDQWGVRLDRDCIGGACAEGARELRVYVDGRRRQGDPRDVVLTNHQEIALVFGGPGAFRSVPSRYTRGWPGVGCGGAGERSCIP